MFALVVVASSVILEKIIFYIAVIENEEFLCLKKNLLACLEPILMLRITSMQRNGRTFIIHAFVRKVWIFLNGCLFQKGVKVPKLSNKPEDFPKFEPLSKEIIAEKALNLRTWIWDNESDIPKGRLAVSNECVIDIIDLVEKRRVYFHIFHGIEMSEWNEAALYCFWILKLQPFYEIPQKGRVNNQALSYQTLFAEYLHQEAWKQGLPRLNAKACSGHPAQVSELQKLFCNEILNPALFPIQP